MVNTEIPMLDAQMDEQTALYIAILERTLAGQSVQLARYRAVFEAVTGEKHETVDEVEKGGGIEEVAIRAMNNRMGMSKKEARRIVQERQAAVAQETPILGNE